MKRRLGWNAVAKMKNVTTKIHGTLLFVIIVVVLPGCTLSGMKQYHNQFTSLELAKTSENTLFICTDFQDRVAWNKLVSKVKEPIKHYEFVAYVDFVYDIELSNASIEDIVSQFRESENHTFLFIADKQTFTHPDNPVLVIDLMEVGKENTFRATPETLQGIENNLSIANMDFSEFTENVDSDGIFRGFDHGEGFSP